MPFVYRMWAALALLAILSNRAGAQVTLPCEPDSVFNPLLAYDSVSDQDGNVYKTIAIGTQEWMAENLKVSRYRNGEPVSHLPSGTWTSTNSGAWCWYGNDSTGHHCPYGKLYNGYAVRDTRGLCPTGWHIPSDAEWTLLENSLGGYEQAGGKMKSTGLQYWSSPNLGAVNTSGFSGLPGGFRYGVSGVDPFDFKGTLGYWWTATTGVGSTLMFRGLLHDAPSTTNTNFIYRCGMSVRCVNNQPVTAIPPRTPSSRFRLWPNPAREELRLTLPEGMAESPYTLFSPEGKALLSGHIGPGEGRIPVGPLPRGLYFLQVGGAENSPMKVQVH